MADMVSPKGLSGLSQIDILHTVWAPHNGRCTQWELDALGSEIGVHQTCPVGTFSGVKVHQDPPICQGYYFKDPHPETHTCTHINKHIPLHLNSHVDPWLMFQLTGVTFLVLWICWSPTIAREPTLVARTLHERTFNKHTMYIWKKLIPAFLRHTCIKLNLSFLSHNLLRHWTEKPWARDLWIHKSYIPDSCLAFLVQWSQQLIIANPCLAVVICYEVGPPHLGPKDHPQADVRVIHFKIHCLLSSSTQHSLCFLRKL